MLSKGENFLSLQIPDGSEDGQLPARGYDLKEKNEGDFRSPSIEANQVKGQRFFLRSQTAHSG